MKKIKQIIAIMIFLSIPLWMTAQPPAGNPPHPNGGHTPGPNNTPVGGGTGAPIDGGMSILLALGLAYGAKKVYSLKKED
jgi:hypothetical protein